MMPTIASSLGQHVGRKSDNTITIISLTNWCQSIPTPGTDKQQH